MMVEKLGKKRYVLPFAAFLVVACVMSLVVYPMVTAEPKGLPLGILSLDEGAQSPQGALNAGETIVEQILESQDEEETHAVTWTEYDSQEALDEAIENEELYAAIVIPSDFSQSQVDAKTAEAIAAAAQTEQAAKVAAARASAEASETEGASSPNGTTPQGDLSSGAQSSIPNAAAGSADSEIPKISPLAVIIDEGKNPLAASTVKTMLTSMLAEQGLAYTLEIVDEADIGGGTLNMAQQFTVLPVFIMSMICSVALFVATKPAKDATRSQRFKTIGMQAMFILVLSWLIGFGTTALVETSGLSIPSLDTGLFLWLASFCLMLLFVGCLDIATPLGAVVILGCFACGMACGNLPYELLPTLYQDWLYPWVPQHFIGDGIRQIFYTGATAANPAAGGLIGAGFVGAIALCVAPLVAHSTGKAVNTDPPIR
ncbi:ABC transporter permease [Raoultibacter phocaeensis]|uniref:ABC transporter permease n=1 Tax=Raoultibacter phocaeensis TaxID=2479841 RepID=UPI00111A9FB8|nr:ABC transporter permease [Raoultibacter phocaeensis]